MRASTADVPVIERWEARVQGGAETPQRGASDNELPLFSNTSVCPVCGNRREIRVHFDRSCPRAEGDHYHRLCPCGHEWVERC